MPTHVEQLFSEELVERGFGGKVQALIVHKDKAAEEDYQLWLGSQWRAEAGKKGLQDPAEVAAFLETCQTAEAKRAGQTGSWQPAYRLQLKTEEPEEDQEASPEPSHLLAKPSPAAKHAPAAKPPISAVSPLKSKNGASAERAKSKGVSPALQAQQGSRSPPKQQPVGPPAAAGRAVIKAKQAQQDKQQKSTAAALPQPKAQGEREPSGSPDALQQQGSNGAEEQPPQPLEKLPPQEAEQQSFFQRMMAAFRLRQQQEAAGSEHYAPTLASVPSLEEADLYAERVPAEQFEAEMATLKAPQQGRPGYSPRPQSPGSGISEADEVPDAAAALFATVKESDADQYPGHAVTGMSGKPAHVEKGSNAEQSAGQQLGLLKGSINNTAAAAAKLGGASEVGMQEGSEDCSTGDEKEDSSDAAEVVGDTDAPFSSSLSVVGAALGATLRGFVQKLTMSFGQPAPEADETPGRDPAAAAHAAEGHAESALLATRGTASRSSMFSNSTVGRSTLKRSGNNIKEPAMSRTLTKKTTSFKLPDFQLSEADLVALRKKAAAAVASVTAAHQDTEDLLVKLQAEIASAQAADEQQSSAYAASISPDALAGSGPTAAERAEMFNAVSKATMETARLMAVFDANLALIQQAQQAMKEIDLARHVADHDTHLDLRNGVKYATETNIAMKSMVAACVKTAAEIAAGVVSAKREQPGGEGLAEDALKQREDLLAIVKAGTDAAISLKALLEAELSRAARLAEQITEWQLEQAQVMAVEPEAEADSHTQLANRAQAAKAVAAKVAEAQLASGSVSDASSGKRTKLRVALKKGTTAAAGLQKLAGPPPTAAGNLLEKTRAAGEARAKLTAALLREQDSNELLKVRCKAALKKARSHEKKLAAHKDTDAADAVIAAKPGAAEGAGRVSQLQYQGPWQWFARHLACGVPGKVRK